MEKLFWRAIGGNNDLLFLHMKIVEEIVENFLRLILVRKKLNIINQKHIHLIKLFHQICHFIHPQRLNDLLYELGRWQINHDFFREVLHNFISYRLHKMRLPQSNIPIEKERIICCPWSISHCFRSRKGKLIIRPCNKSIKTITRFKKDPKIIA